MQLSVITEKHELIYDIPPDLPPIWGDIKRIAQVIVNLITNAAKYSPENTAIHLRAYKTGSTVQIDIVDQGAGIPIDSRAVVFEAFSRLKENVQKPGLGLGLAICKGIVEAHGGRIWIADTPNIPGTTVSLTLPTSSEG
jgi:two-component system sensor histidine kinase KdpD